MLYYLIRGEGKVGRINEWVERTILIEQLHVITNDRESHAL